MTFLSTKYKERRIIGVIKVVVDHFVAKVPPALKNIVKSPEEVLQVPTQKLRQSVGLGLVNFMPRKSLHQAVVQLGGGFYAAVHNRIHLIIVAVLYNKNKMVRYSIELFLFIYMS
jgi:hypothetical protein